MQMDQGDRVARGEGAGSKTTDERDEVAEVKAVLRTCPKCQSDRFTDRRVTGSRPASQDASDTELP